MSAQAHTFAWQRGLPLLGSNITPAGGSALSTWRVVGPITEANAHGINNEDKDENARLKGEYHDDLKRTIQLRLKIPSGAALPGLNTVITIASASALTNRYNGTWKVADLGIEFKADDAWEIPVTLVQNEYLTYSAS